VGAVSWPETTLDPIDRLRVMAGVLSGVAVTEVHLDAPFEEVWAFVEDLDRSAATIDPLLAEVRVTKRDGTHWKGKVRTRFLPLWLPLDIEMNEGLCWMQARGRLRRFQYVGMAAVADPAGGTRYGHLEGVDIPGGRYLRWLFRRMIALDAQGISRVFGSPDR
jgi:hypothetical protein